MPDSYVNEPLACHLKRKIMCQLVSPKTLCMLLVIAVLAGISGPFGTYVSLPPLERHIYWLFVVGVTAIVGHVSGTTIEYQLNRFAWSARSRLFAASVLLVFPIFLIVSGVMLSFGFRLDVYENLVLFTQCALVVGGVCLFQHVITQFPIRRAETVSPKLLGRLPHNKRGRIIRLAAQDHYVEIVTDNGSALVLMRFRDAINEAIQEPGVQVHRSHWVALHAVIGRSRNGKNMGLTMCDDSVVPVGRKYRAFAREKGLL